MKNWNDNYNGEVWLRPGKVYDGQFSVLVTMITTLHYVNYSASCGDLSITMRRQLWLLEYVSEWMQCIDSLSLSLFLFLSLSLSLYLCVCACLCACLPVCVCVCVCVCMCVAKVKLNHTLVFTCSCSRKESNGILINVPWRSNAQSYKYCDLFLLNHGPI